MSSDKTLVTHARTEKAQFLGYAVSIYHADDKITRDTHRSKVKRRSANGKVRLGIPFGLPQEVASRYMKHGKVVSDSGLVFHSDAHIIDLYQSRYRGLVEYYQYATDRYRLNYVRYIMETALVKTLASQVQNDGESHFYRKYRGKIDVDGVSKRSAPSWGRAISSPWCPRMHPPSS